MKIHENIEQRSDEWINLRLGKVTCSNLNDVKSKGKKGDVSKTRESYMYKLASEILTGSFEESYSNQYMEWGKETEEEAISAYEKETNSIVKKIGFVEYTNEIGGSPDGFIGDNGLIEIKCPKSTTHLKTILDNKIPTQYISQMQGYMWITNREWCDFVSYDPRINTRKKIFIKRLLRDDCYIEELKDEVNKFLFELNYLLNKFMEEK